MSVKCNYKGVNFVDRLKRFMIIQTIFFSESLNKKPNLKRIDEDWVKKVVKKADLQKDGFTLNQNFDIVPVAYYQIRTGTCRSHNAKRHL